MFVPMTSKALLAAAMQYSELECCLAVDGKWKALHNGWVFASIGFLTQSLQRKATTTTRIRCPPYSTLRIQSREYTTTFVPIIVAIMRNENDNRHVEALYRTLLRHMPCQRFPGVRWTQRVVQFHRDFARSLEHGRQLFFARARPCGDWSHYTRNLQGKSAQAGIGKQQVAVIYELSHATRSLPTVELFSGLWQFQMEAFRRANAGQMLSFLHKTYFHEFAVEELQQFASIRLCSNHQPADRLYLAEWFRGVFSLLPATGGGNQAVEAYHRAWDEFIGKSMDNRTPMNAVLSYQLFFDQIVEGSRFTSGQALSLNQQLVDPRLLRRNGMVAVGEVSAADLYAFKAQHNYLVVMSARHPGVCYVVFKQPPTLQEVLRAHLRTAEGRREAVVRGNVVRRMRVSRKQRCPALTHQMVLNLVASSWATMHPASEAVDPSGARLYIDMIEASGDELQQMLTDSGILPRTLEMPINTQLLRRVLLNFCAVVVGPRAMYPTAPTTAGGPLLGTCDRFIERRHCQHELFVETLDLPGIRDATRSSITMFDNPTAEPSGAEALTFNIITIAISSR